MSFIHTLLWSNSIALAWTWGIGLFFTVQIAIQFGFQGLITYATINAFGLGMFGVINAWIAKKYPNPEEYEMSFLEKAKKFKFAFLLYQFLAITLTLFTVLKYVTLPLGVLSFLVCVMFVGAVIFLGEEFPISKIKYSHAIAGLGVFASLLVLFNSDLFIGHPIIRENFFQPLIVFNSDISYFAFWVPVLIGFMFGPWLDLQHWQRATQIKKEKLSLAVSYIGGGIIFWFIIMMNGLIALAAVNYDEWFLVSRVSNISSTSLLYQIKDSVTQVLNSHPNLHILLGFYISFVCLAALTTFDSGYIALKWYINSLVKDSKNIILSFVPARFFSSPIPWFFLSIIVATTTMHFSQVGKFIARFDPSLEKFFRFELEYYLAFYASFFVMFAVTFIRDMIDPAKSKDFSFLKLFSTGLCSIAIFGIGYFSEHTLIMAFASLIPLLYGIFTFSTDAIYKKDTDESILNSQLMIPAQDLNLPPGAIPVPISGCYMLDNWFVHNFIPTYQDTNSVGNVYFAMYGMWVGKTRELFFLHTLPDFDPKTSKFLILTRSYEHKFIKETREFEPVTIHVRLGKYNRKFVDLEHKIFNSANELLGKGKQSLMFVDSKNYSLIDIPNELYATYLPYASS